MPTKKTPKRSRKSAQSTKTATTSPGPEPEPVMKQEATTPPEPPAPATSPLSPELQTEFASLTAQIQQAQSVISAVRAAARALEKRATRELKAARKAGERRKRKQGNRSPSGFVKPTLISNELAAFLGKDKGTEMARTEVTREINAYIRAHNLQDKNNGRKINADSKLSKLLKLDKSDELTYFNLQKFMSPHFAKATATASTSQ